jgi:hypothetical protein
VRDVSKVLSRAGAVRSRSHASVPKYTTASSSGRDVYVFQLTAMAVALMYARRCWRGSTGFQGRSPGTVVSGYDSFLNGWG